MFDRVSEAAEKLATNVSRREFMGRLGKAALAVAGALGFAVAAAEGGNFVYCCNYTRGHGISECMGYDWIQFCSATKCPKSYSYGVLVFSLAKITKMATCASCPNSSGSVCI
jgi:hypothetical protein